MAITLLEVTVIERIEVSLVMLKTFVLTGK